MPLLFGFIYLSVYFNTLENMIKTEFLKKKDINRKVIFVPPFGKTVWGKIVKWDKYYIHIKDSKTGKTKTVNPRNVYFV